MADKEELSDVEQTAAGKKSSKMLLIMVVNIALVGGVLAYLFVFNKPKESAAAGVPAAAHVAVGNLGEPGPLVQIDNFIVNLADQDANRYLKMGLSLELAAEEVKELISKRDPMIRDAIISLTSSQSFKQVRTNQGKLDLRENIRKRLDEILGRGVVRGVYFTEFVVQ